MTSNQIAWAALQEDKRHNVSVEIETNRHNEATEQLAEQQNSINLFAAQSTDRYRTKENELKEAYNKWYAEWTTASGKRRLAIEQELNDLTRLRDQNAKKYQDEQYELGQQKNAIDMAFKEEQGRHNEALEALEAARIERDYIFKEKQLEYQNTWQRWQQDVDMFKAEGEVLYKTGMLNLAVDDAPWNRGMQFYSSLEKAVKARGIPILNLPFGEHNYDNLRVSNYLDMFK